MNKANLQIRNLSKAFGDKKALSRVSLDIQGGEIMGLVGPNGAGKTTMIKLIMGLLRPDSGTRKIFGKEFEKLNREDWSKIGYIADEPNLYDFMTVSQLISFNASLYGGWNSEKCSTLLSNFNLPVHEAVKNLSRGMKAQLSLILALSQEPILLVLDEPLEGLDPLRRLQFLNLVLDQFMQDGARSILISSHYLEELERIADRVAFLQEGSLKRVVPMEQFKKEEKTIRVVFQKEPPSALLKMEGVKDVQREGKTGYLLTVEDNFSGIYEALSSYPHYILEIYHRSLEDIFYEYSGEGEPRGDN